MKKITKHLDKSRKKSKLSPHRDKILYLRSEGYSYSVIKDFLFNEFKINITRQSLSAYISRELKKEQNHDFFSKKTDKKEGNIEKPPNNESHNDSLNKKITDTLHPMFMSVFETNNEHFRLKK
ncbi:hypothetical protein ABLA30_13560 [Xenorhabdus nematophila]|uniref:hypothetical protein n=1 Tax=Xenorhabdus nematophila TaxID=628 RepID=UPI0032B73090